MKLEWSLLTIMLVALFGMLILQLPRRWPPEFHWPPPLLTASATPSPQTSTTSNLIPLASSTSTAAVDTRLPADEPIVGFAGQTEELVISRRALPERTVFESTLDGQPVVIVVSLPDKRLVGYYVRTKDGQLTLYWDGDKLKDKETGSVWDMATATATDGQYKGSTLPSVIARSSSWGDWSRTFTNSRIVK